MRAVATMKWRLGSGFSINRNNGSPSKPARRRTGERASDEGAGRGKRERGSVSCGGRGFGYVNSQRETRLGSARLDEAASPAECITNAFCVIRLKR